MSEETQYRDADHNPVSLGQLCRTEPAWAANRIVTLEREIEVLRQHTQHLVDVVSAYVDTVGGVNESAYQSVKADRLAREAGE